MKQNFLDHKLGPKFGFLQFSQGCIIFFFVDIAQDCSLGQFLTSSRAETYQNIIMTQIGAEIIFFILMSSSIHLDFRVFFSSVSVSMYEFSHAF